MPAILKKSNHNELSIGLWEITESYEDLLKTADLNKIEQATLLSFKNEGRQLQWLAVRVLLGQFINPRPTILYKENGKPYLEGNNTEISISHSGNMAAIALSNTIIPGIDVEQIHPKINKIAHRFVSDKEMGYLKQDMLTEQLCVIWAAKEVLYKTHPEGMLNFKENLAISSFPLKDTFEFEGTINKDGSSKTYKLTGQKIQNYVLVYTEE